MIFTLDAFVSDTLLNSFKFSSVVIDISAILQVSPHINLTRFYDEIHRIVEKNTNVVVINNCCPFENEEFRKVFLQIYK